MSASDALGEQWHPNVQSYRSGGIGHLEGDESRSVVGFLPTRAVAQYRHHDGEWTGHQAEHPRDRAIIDSIRHDLRSGHGLEEPLELDYHHRAGWAALGEGNHRLRAAEEEGVPVVPVRVVGRSGFAARAKEKGIGAPAHLQGPLPGAEHDPDYEPPTFHPSHLDVFRDRR